MRTVIYLAWIAFELCASAQPPPTQAAVDLKKKIILTVQGTRLQRLSQLGADQGIPVGIVTRGLNLCDATESKDYTRVELGKILDSFLSDSAYQWHLQDGVLRVRPTGDATPIEDRVLQTKLPTFGGMRTTIQGLGVMLSGTITTILHPGSGYAGSIMASLDAENIPAFIMHDVTVEEAANSIVSRGSKGLWIFYQTGEAEVKFRTFGYKDDANVLTNIGCVGEQQ